MIAPKNVKSPPVTINGRTMYLTNKEILPEVLLSKSQGKMTNALAKMLQLLCSRYAKKSNYAGYPYNDDMQSYAIMQLVHTWSKFDPAKSSNPFAFYTQCIKNSFNFYLNQEKRHRTLRDALMVDVGLTPSFGYSEGLDSDDREVMPVIDILRNEDAEPDPIARDERGFESVPVFTIDTDMPIDPDVLAEVEDGDV